MSDPIVSARGRASFHPLSAADYHAVRSILRRDDRFRMSHLGPLAVSFLTRWMRSRWIAKTRAEAAALPDDWHRRRPPIFVVGFWRSGTTLFHELLTADRDLVAPKLADVLCPSDAPYLKRYKRRLIGAIAPTNRAVDDVDIKPASPQEEDFALAQLGAPSFFGVSYFPANREAEIERAMFFENDPQARAQWREAHERFLRIMTVKYAGKRLVLKNPPNSTRIPDLLDLYPDALFVRIDRDPAQVVPSFQRMTDTANRTFSLQGDFPPCARDYAERFHARVIDKLDADWDLTRFRPRAEVRYEQLIADPLGTVRRVYDDLGLPLTASAVRRQEGFWAQRGSLRRPATSKAAPAA